MTHGINLEFGSILNNFDVDKLEEINFVNCSLNLSFICYFIRPTIPEFYLFKSKYCDFVKKISILNCNIWLDK